MRKRKRLQTIKTSVLGLCLCILGGVSSCNPLRDYCPFQDEGVESDCMSTLQILNTRFEVRHQESLRESNTIWLRSGEELVVRWDSYTTFHTFNGASCDFASLSEETDNCGVCNWCNSGPAFEQLCPFDTRAIGGRERLRLVTHEGFMDPPSPPVFMADTSGCSARDFTPLVFMPAGNAGYQVLPPDYVSEVPLKEKKVFVIQNGMTQTTSYALTKYASDSSSGKDWYQWTVQGDPIWEDNFSKNVRIGRVRVLTGRPGTDPNTGRFRLEEAKVVRPSRILFFSNFAAIDTSNGNLSNGSDILSHPFENFNRCYANPSREDGDINLAGLPGSRTECRQDSPGSRENDFAATPTYLVSEPETQLTWFVEFYELEGADFDPTTAVFDPIPPDAFLVIEFSIEPVP
jgi:hypothetical protein